MNKFVGEKCSICNKEFKDDDQIVVCPECGTPYHKSCYKQVGNCLYESSHGKYFYKPVAKTKQDDCNKKKQPEKKQIMCPYCNELNHDKDKVCSNCGMPLDIGPEMFIFNTEKIIKEEKIFGINIKDWFSYLGSGALFYLIKFKSIEKNKYSFMGFNVSAFFFNELYFFYRKMYLAGTIFFLIRMLISIIFLPTSLLKMILNGFEKIMLSDTSSYNFIIEQLMTFINKYPQVVNYIEFGHFILAVIMGFFATTIYKNVSVKKIKSINRQMYVSDVDYRDVLSKKGSVNHVVIFVIVFLILCLRGLIIRYFW